MQSRSVAAAVAFTVLSAGGAIGSYVRASSLESEADWLLLRAQAEAAQYASSFNGAYAEKQLATFEEREALVMGRAARWRLVQMVLVLMSVVGLFASYVLYLFRRLREQLVDAAPDMAEPSPHPRP
jgi:hypothetical protein